MEPKADWTETAKRLATETLREELSVKNAILIPYVPPTGDPTKAHRHTQLIKLHRAVAEAILRHKYDVESRLAA